MRTFYVIFEYTPVSSPDHKFILSKWGHCFTLESMQSTCVSINMLTSFISVHNYDNKAEILINEYVSRETVLDIVKISLPFEVTKAYTVRGLLNCVTLVKALLGIKKFFIFTPKQLHSHLLTLGGESLKGKEI